MIRRAGLAAAAACVVGCGAILGLEDKLPPEEFIVEPADAAKDSASADVLDPQPLADASRDGAGDALGDVDGNDGAPSTIDCLGVPRNAFFCDGFEDANLDPRWQTVLLPGAPPAEVGTTALRKISGARSFYSGFPMLPNTGTARIRWAHPKPGPLAMQVTFFFFGDAWSPNDVVPLAALRVNGANAATLIWKHTSNENGNVDIHVDGQADVALGPMKVNDWTCFEMFLDGTKVRTWAGATEKLPSLPLAGAADGAEIGFEWLYGPDTANSKYVGADDIVFAPAPIGCLH